MKVKQFRYSADNLGYLVYGARNAVAVDAGAVDEMTAFAETSGLTITVVTNTHAHFDHVSGNHRMVDATGAQFLDPGHVLAAGGLEIDTGVIKVFHTPGHTDDSVTFKAGDSLITGDTLFNGTVGNCFSGDMKRFLASLSFLLTFPPGIRIYAGHDYVRESMAFARSLEPGNPAIDAFLAGHDPWHVVSTLAEEIKVNPYLRFNDPAMIRLLKLRGLPVESEYDRWTSIMSLG
ncbi:MAG: MBL fold metallo-hydrolase [Pseudomonadota bacterium]